MMNVQVSKDNHSRMIDREKLIMLDKIELKMMHKDKEGDQYRKKK